MEILELMKQRHSVRQYKDIAIGPEQRIALNHLIEEINGEAGLHIQIFYDEPQCFDSMMAHYGKFSGVKNYIALVGKKSPKLEEALGYYGEKIVLNVQELNSVYTRSGQNSTPNSNATNLHSSQKRCCSFCISSSNASPTFQVQKSIFHQMTKPIQVTVILPLLLAISFSRNDDIHSSISGISNDLIGVIPTIGQ